MATEFHRYPELPKEIQIKIWKLACEEPRVIELGATPKKPVVQRPSGGQGRYLAADQDYFEQLQKHINPGRPGDMPFLEEDHAQALWKP